MSTTEPQPGRPAVDRLATGRAVESAYPITARTLRSYVNAGKLTAWQIGGKRFYNLDEIDALLVPVRRGA